MGATNDGQGAIAGVTDVTPGEVVEFEYPLEFPPGVSAAFVDVTLNAGLTVTEA